MEGVQGGEGHLKEASWLRQGSPHSAPAWCVKAMRENEAPKPQKGVREAGSPI